MNSRDNWRDSLSLLLAVPVLLAFAWPGSAAPPGDPAPLTAAQKDQIERSKVKEARAAELWNGKQRAEALALLEEKLADERKAFPDGHETVVATLARLASLYTLTEDYPAARAKWKEALALRQSLYGEKDWRVTDVRLHLTHTDKLEELGEKGRQRLAKAEAQHRDSVKQLRGPGAARALEDMKKVVAEYKDLLGPKHHDTATGLNDLAHVYEVNGDPAAAERLFLEAIAIRKEVLGEEHPGYAAAVHNLAVLYHDTGRVAKAEPLFRDVLRIRKKVLGERDPNYLYALGNFADLYASEGAFAKAEPLYRDLVRLRREVPGQKREDYARSLNGLAALYREMGQYDRAVPPAKEAADVRKAEFGEGSREYARALNNVTLLVEEQDVSKARELLEQVMAIQNGLGEAGLRDHAVTLNNYALLLKSLGEYGRAEESASKSLALVRKLDGEKAVTTANSLNTQALVYQARGRDAKAESCYRQALELLETALGDRKYFAEYGVVLNNLATLYETRGDFGKAETLLEQALKVFKKTYPEDHPAYTAGLQNLAQVYQSVGDLARAEALLRRVLELTRRGSGENHPDTATTMNDLALLYQQAGDEAGAEQMMRRSLEIAEKAFGKKHPQYASSLNNLASLLHDRREFDAAEKLYKEALSLHAELAGPDHRLTIIAKENLATMYIYKGGYREAERLLLEVLAVRKTVNGEKHLAYGGTLNNLGGTYERLGAYDKAEDHYRRALDVFKGVFGTERHPEYVKTLANLGALSFLRGDAKKALSHYNQALDFYEGWLESMFGVLGERQRIAAGAESLARGTLGGYLSAASLLDALPPESYDRVLAWKGATAARRTEERLAREQPRLRPLLEELNEARSALSNRAQAVPPPEAREKWLKELDALSARKEDLESRLSEKSADFLRERQARRVKAAQIMAELPADVVLIDFFEYSHRSRPGAGRDPLARERRLLAFVLTRGRGPTPVPLGESAPIYEAALAWRKAAAGRNSAGVKSAAADLARLVWRPLRDHLGGAKVVLLSPDGPLNLFPFAALPGRRDGSYLIEDVAIGYVSSGRHAYQLLRDKPQLAPAGLLALGGIDFNAKPAAAAAAGRRAPVDDKVRAGFLPLPGTAAEAVACQELFRQAFPKGDSAVLTKGEPDKVRVKKELVRPWRYFHFAGHGFFAPPQYISGLRLGVANSEAGLSEPERRSLVRNPLLLSGLVLAGGARPEAAAGGEDGILTAEEVMGLDMRGTELAVLSACETGLGAVAGGEGVLGLRRAFEAAGESLVVSLWKVDDEATRALFGEFYRNLWEKKLGKLEALCEAQRAMLRSYDPKQKRLSRGPDGHLIPVDPKVLEEAPIKAPTVPPFFWAAFILSGEWR